MIHWSYVYTQHLGCTVMLLYSELLSNGTTFKWNYFQKQPSSHLYSYKPHVPLTDLFPALKLFDTCFDMTSLATRCFCHLNELVGVICSDSSAEVYKYSRVTLVQIYTGMPVYKA